MSSQIKYYFRLEGDNGKNYHSSQEFDATLNRITALEGKVYTLNQQVYRMEQKFRVLEAPQRRDAAVRRLREAGKMHNKRWFINKADIWYDDIDILIAEGRLVEVRRGRSRMLALPEWDTGPRIEYEPGHAEAARR